MAEKHPTKLVAYTPRLDKALKRLTKWSDSIDLKTKNPSGKRQSIETSIPVETETETGYNGYFKLIDMSETDANGVTHYRLGIADGATFDGKTSGPSKAVSDGNGRSYDVPFHVIDVPDEVIDDTVYYYYVVIPYSTTEGTGLARLQKTLNTDTDTAIGLVRVDKDSQRLVIRQTFNSELLHINVEYEGEFTVSITHTDLYEDGTPKVIICNGKNPESEICGSTDIGDVPKFTLPKNSYAGETVRLYIGARYNKETQKSEMAFYTGKSYAERPSWANEIYHAFFALGYIWYRGDGRYYFGYSETGNINGAVSINWGTRYYIP